MLVRSRGELASLIVARLFSAGVPVAGVDRLHLHEPLAVQDLLAAVKFAVQPNDDLSLACLLVSPLIGWDQEQLRELAFGEVAACGASCGEARARVDAFGAAHEALAELLRIADFTPPSRFLETILTGPMQGRRKLYSRLGMAARDPIDELMNSALEFERDETASLDRFLSWFSRGTVDVQRDPGQPANEVRVMTVHGAKGLEAPVVILADATADPARLGRTPLTLDFEVPGIGVVPFLRPKKDERMPAFRGDHRRRGKAGSRGAYAASVCRADPRSRPADRERRDAEAEKGWLRSEAAQLLAPYRRAGAWKHRCMAGVGHVGLRYEAGTAARPKRTKDKVSLPFVVIPKWARNPAPAEARPPRPLAPSAIAVDDENAPPPSEAMRAAALRGTWIHQLLEKLPPVEPGARPGAANRWLGRSAGVSDPAVRDEIVAQVCGILSDPQFAELFGANSFGEAPLAATLPDGRVIAGTADRLLIEKDRVSVLDFKTGRVPESAASIPAAHLAQMHAYTAALRVIFPDRQMRAALLYTGGPQLFELQS